MSKYSGDDPYLDPVTGVLKNRFGLIDPDILDQAEADLVSIRSYELAQTPLPGDFDLAHLRAIHRHLFSDVYEWAGELRTIDISKGGHLFAHHAHIEGAANSIFTKLAEERHLAGRGPEDFSGREAHYLGELNALHPFREGNGRTQREFMSHLALANGYYIAWEKVRREEMLEASIESFRGDTSKLQDLIRTNLSTLEREGTSRGTQQPGLSIDEIRDRAGREQRAPEKTAGPKRSEGFER